MKKNALNRNKKIFFLLIFLCSFVASFAQTTTFYDFNTPGDLTTYFTRGNTGTTQINQSLNTGIGGTGAVFIGNQSANEVYTTKQGYSNGGVGSVYEFSTFIKSEFNSGYSAIGFTSLPNQPHARNGNPSICLGVSVHGGGFIFYNNSTASNGDWRTGGVVNASMFDLLNNGSPDKWYKIILKITAQTNNNYHLQLEVWPSNSNGVLLHSTASAIHTRTYQNNNIGNSTVLYSYFGFGGYRVSNFDNYALNLQGSTVIDAGAPVVVNGTAVLSPILNNSIDIEGNVTDDRGISVTEKGFVWNTSGTPTVSDNKIAYGSGLGSFNGTINNLAPGTYYLRAYAINSNGISYGIESIVIVPTQAGEIFTSTSNLEFNLCPDSSELVKTFTVSATGIGSNVSLSAVNGFSYSLDNNNFASTLTINSVSGQVNTTTVYVKFININSTSNGILTISATNALGRSIGLNASVLSTSINSQPTVTNETVCINATPQTISITANDATAFQWYQNSSNTITGATIINGATSTSYSLPTNNPGTVYYFARVSFADCASLNSNIISQTVTPTLGSISSISGTTNLAPNATMATYSIPAVIGATSYVWNLPPGMTITSSTGNEIQVSVSSTFVSGTVSVKALNACSESSVHVLSVSKQNSVLSITGASIVCISEGSVVETYIVPTIEGATSYVWTVPSGSFISSGENTNSVSITYNASFTRGTIRVSAIGANGVISSGSLSIGGLELPGVITGSTQICSAGTYEYSISPVESATSYEWVLPSGMILQGDGTGTNISVVTSSSVNGTILVRALSSCGSSQPRTLSISGVPTPGYIYGERVICGATSNAVDLNGNVNTTAQSGIYTYSILPVIGADSYTWTLPTGVNLISGQGTRIIQVSFESSFESGNIRVVSNSTSCGTSSPRSVFVSSVSSSLTGPVTICGLNTATYSVAAGSGSDFVWSLPQGMSIISGEGSNSISVSINNPINFINNNQVTVSFTTPCGGTRVVSLIVDCPDYSNLTNCGSTVAFNERVFTRSIRGASMYAFDIYDSNDVLLTTYQTRGNFFQFVQALPSFVFGSTYNVQVRVQRNGVYEDAGTSCSVTIATPTTTIQSSQCNGTILLQDRVYVTSVWDGVTYAFDIYDEQGDFITTLEKSSNFFRLSEFASVYGMTYQIGVRVKRGNGSYGAQGSRCNLTLSIPTTSLAANQCGTTINIADRIYARSVLNATMYAFRIYDANGIFITELERPYNFFRITDITYTAGATYQVGVKVKQGEGNYGLEGSLCSIILNGPATTALESSQCGTSMLYTDLIYATSVSDANGYRFNVYNVAGSTLVASIESATNSFSFSQLTGYTFDTSYQIRVQVLRGTEFGVEGTPCTVTILKENPAPTRAVVVAEPEQTKTNPITELKAYPNPFTSTFQITPIAEETATLFYQVYDVTGKMIESQSVEANNVEYHTIGDMYPVGMYLVIVRQGATTQTFKMVKQ
jgi:hypothetical protein